MRVCSKAPILYEAGRRARHAAAAALRTPAQRWAAGAFVFVRGRAIGDVRVDLLPLLVAAEFVRLLLAETLFSEPIALPCCTTNVQGVL